MYIRVRLSAAWAANGAVSVTDDAVRLEPLGVHVQTVPEFEQLVTGVATVEDIREVDVCDLLGRDSVPPKAGLFDACVRDRVCADSRNGCNPIRGLAVAPRLHFWFP